MEHISQFPAANAVQPADIAYIAQMTASNPDRKITVDALRSWMLTTGGDGSATSQNAYLQLGSKTNGFNVNISGALSGAPAESNRFSSFLTNTRISFADSMSGVVTFLQNNANGSNLTLKCATYPDHYITASATNYDIVGIDMFGRYGCSYIASSRNSSDAQVPATQWRSGRLWSDQLVLAYYDKVYTEAVKLQRGGLLFNGYETVPDDIATPSYDKTHTTTDGALGYRVELRSGNSSKPPNDNVQAPYLELGVPLTPQLSAPYTQGVYAYVSAGQRNFNTTNPIELIRNSGFYVQSQFLPSASATNITYIEKRLQARADGSIYIQSSTYFNTGSSSENKALTIDSDGITYVDAGGVRRTKTWEALLS